MNYIKTTQSSLWEQGMGIIINGKPMIIKTASHDYLQIVNNTWYWRLFFWAKQLIFKMFK